MKYFRNLFKTLNMWKLYRRKRQSASAHYCFKVLMMLLFRPISKVIVFKGKWKKVYRRYIKISNTPDELLLEIILSECGFKLVNEKLTRYDSYYYVKSIL